VIGLGAGGSVMLREFARAGVEVLGIEAGPKHAKFNQREDEMLAKLFVDGGGQTTSDLAIRVLQGVGIGGSTVHNTNLCKRTPAEILDLWQRKYKVSGLGPELVDLFAQMETELSVSEIPESMQNRNNQLLRKGAGVLGYRSGRLLHNRVGCMQSGFCELGCSYDAKQNAAKIMVPAALAAGARVAVSARATRILWQAGQVTGVIGENLDALGRVISPFVIQAKVVVLAGSAPASAALAYASRLPDPFERIGERLFLHPGAFVTGLFDEEVVGYEGIPQSYECTEFLEYPEESDKRVWIVPAFAHPIGAASMASGFGAAHQRELRGYRHLGVFSAMVHDVEPGRVRAHDNGRPKIEYTLGPRDRAQLALGLRACARLLLAAGAREATIASVKARRYRTTAELDADDFAWVQPHELPLSSVHPMGGLAMSDDPRLGATNSESEFHHIKGLFAADGSLFPTSLGTPPQISIYTFAKRASKVAILRAK
jgi:choline dehydrogenase-like flavoprotein